MPNRRKTDQVDIGSGLISVSVFGAFGLKDSQGNPIQITNRRARTLLAMLCIAPNKTFERSFISSLLWPGRYEAQAKASLRQSLLELSKLQDRIGQEFIHVTRTEVQLIPDSINSDLAHLERLFERHDYHQATEILMRLGSDQLLDQMHYQAQFNDWLSAIRSQIEQRLQSSISAGLAKLKSDKNALGYQTLLSAWRVREPLFNFSEEPDPASEKVIKIAVLPFKTLNSHIQDQYFSEGIVDEIITMLGQVPELMVAGKNSSFGLKDSELSAQKIATILNVDHFLEGTVQQQDEKIRINIRLVNPHTGFEQWGNSYKGTVNDVFELQENIANEVTRELSSALNVNLVAPKNPKTTTNRKAYDLFIQGRALLKRMMGAGALENALTCLEQAVQLDPNFAECWATLAETNAFAMIFQTELDPQKFEKRMTECALNATQLSPENGYALVMHGVCKWMQQKPVEALDLAFRAYQLDPKNPAVVARLGSFLSYCGYTKQALPHIAAAATLDPLDGRHLLHLSSALFNTGDYKGAQHIGQKVVSVGFPSFWLAVATAALGDNTLAVKQYAQSQLLMNSMDTALSGTKAMTEQEMDSYWQTVSNGVCSSNPLDRQKYCQLLDYMHATLPVNNDTKIVLPAVWMGHTSLVFKIFSEQITPANMLGLIAMWADIEPINQIRQHPDFVQFTKTIGLNKVWDKYGLPDLLKNEKMSSEPV